MEEYAYRLAIELDNMGVEIIIVCEKVIPNSVQKQFQLVELGTSISKPRWLSHLVFSAKVERWIKDNAPQNIIIHSHERVRCHDLTTFHSSVYNFPSKRHFPSLRNFANEYIEKRELGSLNVKRIVPVSKLISSQIVSKYPEIVKKLSPPVYPGVTPIKLSNKALSLNCPTIGFIGKEWKRKGMLKVIKIWRKIRETAPGVKLCLAGFSKPKCVTFTSIESQSVKFLGYVTSKSDFYREIDLLLHPASFEAFGMVIAEALSLGIPTICSKQCGAAEISNPLLLSLDYHDDSLAWAESTVKLLNNLPTISDLGKTLSWSDVAHDYLKIYQSISVE